MVSATSRAGISRSFLVSRAQSRYTAQSGTRALIAFARALYSMTPPEPPGNPASTARISRRRSFSPRAAISFVVGAYEGVCAAQKSAKSV
jgi:hypothetical protein